MTVDTANRAAQLLELRVKVWYQREQIMKASQNTITGIVIQWGVRTECGLVDRAVYADDTIVPYSEVVRLYIDAIDKVVAGIDKDLEKL